MTNNYTKTMRQALEEARSFRDVATEGGPGSGPQKGGKKFSDKQIKQAYGILNDPRYKQGNYSGASKAIDKLAPGLSNHPDVKNAMKRANETLDLSATGDTTTSNASQEDETVELDEAKLSTAQLNTLKQKYSGLRGSEKNGIQMDKLAKIMKRYPKPMLDQLAGLDIPMVSKVAKAMTEETMTEAWQYEMDIEYGDNDDRIIVFGNVKGATLESQADRKYDQLEKQMQKKYGRDAMIDGGTMRGKTNTQSRGGSDPLQRKDI